MNPLALVLGLEAVALAVGAVGMRALGIPAVAEPNPARDTLAFGAAFLALRLIEAALSQLFPASFARVEELLRQVAALIPERQVILLAAASAVGEEVLFRGLIAGALAERGAPLAAVLISSLAFAAFHPVPDRRAWVYPVYAFLAGVVLAATYLLTRSLIPGILAHYLVNALGFYRAGPGQAP